MSENLRDHGYPDMGEEPSGTPKATTVENGPSCPNCKCELMQVSIPMTNPRLKTGKGIGTFFGCPACPYASQMMTRAVT